MDVISMVTKKMILKNATTPKLVCLLFKNDIEMVER